MHRFYMVQSFTRFHRNVSTMLLVCFTTCFHLALVDPPRTPRLSGHFSSGSFPGRQGGGAAPKAGTRYQGGPRLSQPAGALAGRTQRCKCELIKSLPFGGSGALLLPKWAQSCLPVRVKSTRAKVCRRFWLSGSESGTCGRSPGILKRWMAEKVRFPGSPPPEAVEIISQTA